MTDPTRRGLLLGMGTIALAGCSPRIRPEEVGRISVTALGQGLIQHDLTNPTYPGLSEVAARIARSEVVFGEFEGAFQGSGGEAPTRDPEFLHVPSADVLRTLRFLQINLLALSNNHAYDFGSSGITATLDAVMKAGFRPAGTGRNLAEATAPAFYRARGGMVALVAAATGKIRPGGAATDTRPGVNELRQEGGRLNTEDSTRILGAIRKAATEAALVIVYHHNHDWNDDRTVPPSWLEEWARACIDAGAGLFVGHGLPQLHGVETRRGGVILYDLSSLIFHTRTRLGHYGPESWESALAEMRFADGRLQSLELVPVQLNEQGADPAQHLETRGRPTLATGADAARIMDRIAARSERYGTKFRQTGGVLQLVLP